MIAAGFNFDMVQVFATAAPERRFDMRLHRIAYAGGLHHDLVSYPLTPLELQIASWAASF